MAQNPYKYRSRISEKKFILKVQARQESSDAKKSELFSLSNFELFG